MSNIKEILPDNYYQVKTTCFRGNYQLIRANWPVNQWLALKYMNTHIDKSIIQRTKDILQIDEELSSIELLKLTKNYRKRIHPDKFSEEKAAEEAGEKFKEIGSLIDELDRYIQNEKLQRSAQELALYAPLYDNVSLQGQLDDALEKVQTLEEEAADLTKKNAELEESLKIKKDDELEKENIELKNLYKPSGQKMASLGIMFLLSASFAVMTKIEEVSVVLKKYSPVPESMINNVIFSIFIFLLILVIKQLVENHFISKKSNEVCSPKFSKEFIEHLKETNEYEENKAITFSESNAFSFIYGKDNKFKKLLSILGFRLFNIDTSDKLKNYFINSLLNKKLIVITHAKDLDRNFAIKNGHSHYVLF